MTKKQTIHYLNCQIKALEKRALQNRKEYDVTSNEKLIYRLKERLEYEIEIE